MIGSPTALHDVHKYDGEQHIQNTNGNTLSITTIGNLESSITNVFISPNLSVNLISVGQLVEKTVLFILIDMVVVCRIKHRDGR